MPAEELTLLLPSGPPGAPKLKPLVGVGKPSACLGCQFHSQGAGYVPDFAPESPRLALVLDNPSGDDVLQKQAWAGKAGYAWRKKYLEPLGLGRGDVLLSNILRCKPKWGYPVGGVKRAAEITCRQYDDKLVAWSPDLFVVTMHPSEAAITPALGDLIFADLKKAVGFADKGWKPAVLMGTDVMELVAPWLAKKGGAHDWRGTFWAGEWPWKEDGAMVKPMFLSGAPQKKRKSW